MDEMKIKSPVMQNMVCRIIEMVLRKRLGCQAILHLNDFEFTSDDNMVNVRIDISGKMKRDALVEMVTKLMSNRES